MMGRGMPPPGMPPPHPGMPPPGMRGTSVGVCFRIHGFSVSLASVFPCKISLGGGGGGGDHYSFEFSCNKHK